MAPVFSVSPAEILTIAVVALLVFGPRRLPEIARRAGKVIRDLRDATQELRSGLEREYGDVVGPLSEASGEIRSALDGLPPDSAGPQPPSAPPEEAAGPDDEDRAR
jgi:Tat protein translocase TatB subunit